MGGLQNGITHYRESPLTWVLVSRMTYSAYVEFGTKSRTQIPPGLESFAAGFKGGGQGDYFDFLNAILDWVNRKGIAARFSVQTHKRLKTSAGDRENLIQIAEEIAFSIIRHGVHPHPFFFPAVEQEKPKMIQRIREVLQ